MRAVIFLGPSLPLPQAKEILDAIYLPPARQADVVSAVTTYKPDLIGIIDGMFLQELSVWHKEILYAIDQGVLVYGASSMGALRAAETAHFGMIGVGEVYRMYASGELNDDDEVALAHSSAEMGYQKLSEPMVNVRATLYLARDKGIIDEALCQKIISVAKSMYFPERIFPLIFKKATAEGVPHEVLQHTERFVAENYQDIKRQDAILLLKTIRDLPVPLPKPAKAFTFTQSYLFQALYNCDRTVQHEGVDIPLAMIANYVALHSPDFTDLNFHALNRALVLILADLLSVTVSQEDQEQEIWRFRTRHKLMEEEKFAAWLTKNDLSMDEFITLMHEMALCRALHRWLMIKKYLDRSTKFVLDELRLQNWYEEWAEKAAIQERLLQMHYPAFRETSQHTSMKELLSDHLRQTGCRIDTHFSIWAEESGFHTIEDLRIELLRSRLAREVPGKLNAQLADIIAGEQIENPGTVTDKDGA